MNNHNLLKINFLCFLEYKIKYLCFIVKWRQFDEKIYWYLLLLIELRWSVDEIKIKF
jgi:hypothetical protein